MLALEPIATEFSPNADALSEPSPFALIFTYALVSGTTIRVVGTSRFRISGSLGFASLTRTGSSTVGSTGSLSSAYADPIEATTSAVAAAIFDFAERDDFERPRAISDAAHQVLVEAFHTTRYDLFIRTFSFGKPLRDAHRL
ncbi:hypothetical protein NUJ30_17730 [Burkholderia contaminans]|uniref:Uncharacterized protein n=1 Tax=Burkholderia contaminans TaxID=488447 RepID=A0AAP4VLQ6_9BURK|nr:MULTISPECIES: hypothetical protein [Burkholderia]MDN7569054.1 hypothetical protein [Burkholderia contaminans]MDN8026691.1 hypothetical protein [Burkholderia contaminans]UXZ67051.1 hypothetical protein NUJ29_17725 [Burkholderia contaminans]UXZ74812.1 hypothetical protein NUJ30_17730 [Burkholderia contaminans]